MSFKITFSSNIQATEDPDLPFGEILIYDSRNGKITISNLKAIQAEIERLQEQNKKLVEALEFYASEDNWFKIGEEHPKPGVRPVIDFIDIEVNHQQILHYGGKVARKVLQEINAIKE